MIAADFLELRGTIAKQLLALSRHARESGGDETLLQTLDLLSLSLREPLGLIVLGPSGAGKSAVLETLAGTDFYCENDTPITQFAFGPSERDESLGAGITLREYPLPLLRELQFVDTAGCEHLGQHLEVLRERYFREADAVLFVLSAGAPFEEGAWEFVAKLDGPWRSKIIFVISKCDVVSEDEITLLSDRVARKAASVLGGRFPVIAFSALAAQSDGSDDETSGLAALERIVNAKLLENDAHRERLASVCATALDITRELSAQAREADSLAHAGSGRLTALDARVDEQKLEALHRAGGMVWGVDQFYGRALKRVEGWLIAQLAVPAVFLLIGRRPVFDVADEIDVKLRESIERHVRSSLASLEAGLKTAWTRLHQTLSRELDEGGGLPAGGPPAINEGNALQKQIDQAIESTVSSSEVGRAMLEPLAVLGRWLRVPLGVLLAGVFIAGVALLVGGPAGLSGWKFVAMAGAAIAVAALVAAWMLAVSRGSRLSIELRGRMDAQRERVLRTIEEHLRHSISQFHERLRDSLHSVPGVRAAQEVLVIEPAAAHLGEIEAALAECARRLSSAPSG